jgi:hypothetical protein
MDLRASTRRVLRALLTTLAVALAGYALWRPGVDRQDGANDRGTNAAWLAHGWLGDASWFTRNRRDPRRFRDPPALSALASRLRTHHVTTVYPHLCPAESAGPAPHDAAATERFLDAMDGVRVMPWVGGVYQRSVLVDDAAWRRRFAESVARLLREHPRLAGVHLNVEPWPDGDTDMLRLLDSLRSALPPGRSLSVAAYPPPTRWQPDPEIHWSAGYTREVARRADELAVMMYDTAIVIPKAYESLLVRWTREVLASAAPTRVLLGVPTYPDEPGAGWHRAWVEDLPHALRGIHAGLGASAPANYQGIAIYAEWETEPHEWSHLRAHFLSPRPTHSPASP